MEENSAAVKRVIGNLNENIVPKVKKNNEIIQEFLKKLDDEFKKHMGPDSFSFHVLHGGSVFENLAVTEKVDFDISLKLGDPFVGKNFVIERDSSGHFTLQVVPVALGKIPEALIDDENYLQASVLRKQVFKYLRTCVESVCMSNTEISCYDATSALTATIKQQTLKLSVDLVPQISCHNWDQCPDHKSLQQMPKKLKEYIEGNPDGTPSVFFSLGIPNADSIKMKMRPRLFNISFSMLEKAYLRSYTDIRDMVRLVKLTAKLQKWKKVKTKNKSHEMNLSSGKAGTSGGKSSVATSVKKPTSQTPKRKKGKKKQMTELQAQTVSTLGADFQNLSLTAHPVDQTRQVQGACQINRSLGCSSSFSTFIQSIPAPPPKQKRKPKKMPRIPFKSFYAKRVALKYHDQLVGKDLWEGFLLLLGFIATEIGHGKIDGYFIRNQVMHEWSQSQINAFKDEVQRIRQMNAREIFIGH